MHAVASDEHHDGFIGEPGEGVLQTVVGGHGRKHLPEGPAFDDREGVLYDPSAGELIQERDGRRAGCDAVLAGLDASGKALPAAVDGKGPGIGEHPLRGQILCHPVEARARVEHVVEPFLRHGQRLVETLALIVDVEPGAERGHDERDGETRDDADQPSSSRFCVFVGLSHR